MQGIGIDLFEEHGLSLADLTNLNPRPLFAAGMHPTLVSISPGGYYARGGSHVLDNYTATWANPPVASLAAGRVMEYGDNCGIADHPDVEYPLGSMFLHHWLIDLWFNQDGIRQGPLGTNCMCGFGVGSLLAAPPNPVTSAVGPPFAAAPANPTIQVQLRHNAGQDDIYLYTALGDGSTPATATRLNLGQDLGVTGLAAQYNFPHRVQLEFNPATAKATLRCTDFYDQKIRTIVNDMAGVQPNNLTGFYLFAYTGTGAATGQQVSFGPGTLYTFRSDWALS